MEHDVSDRFLSSRPRHNVAFTGIAHTPTRPQALTARRIPHLLFVQSIRSLVETVPLSVSGVRESPNLFRYNSFLVRETPKLKKS